MQKPSVLICSLAGDLLHDGDRAERRRPRCSRPRCAGRSPRRRSPAHHEDAVALRDGVADQRVLGLQVEDVELVDARRHEQDRPLVHLRRQRLVLDQLEQLVLEDHRALGRRDVAADLERALVGLRQVAALGVVPELVSARAAMLSPLVSIALLCASGLSARKLLGAAASIHCCTAKRMRALRLRVGVDALGERSSVRALSRYICGEERRRRVRRPSRRWRSGGRSARAPRPPASAAGSRPSSASLR